MLSCTPIVVVAQCSLLVAHCLLERINDELGGLERAQSGVQKMSVLCEEGIVLDRVAEAADLLGELVSAVIHQVEGLGDIIILCLVVIELDRARVDIAVFHLPDTQLVFEGLELRAIEEEILGSHDQISALKAFLRVRAKQAEDWYTTNTPFRNRLRALANSHGDTCHTLLNHDAGSKATSRAKGAIELRRVA